MTKRLTQEDRAYKARTQLERAIGREMTGGTAMLITARYLMGGGYPFFGHHGGAILPFYEALYTDSEFNRWYVHVPHEQIAGHAAQGFAASTGKVGVAIVTSGPGATNLTTPCDDAMMDSDPMMIIAGDAPRAWAGSRAFQETPRSVFNDISKKVYYIDDARNIPAVLSEAYRLARSGRPGPVVVVVPKDVQAQQIKFSIGDLETEIYEDAPLDIAMLTELSKRVGGSKRPVLYIGGGVKSAEAWNEIRELVNKTGIPVAYSLKGKGVFPDDHQLCMGPLGMHGSATANYGVDEADLLIAVGARFSDRAIGDPVRFAPNAYIAQLDIDPQGIGPKGKRQPQMVVRGNVKDSLSGLLNKLADTPPDLGEWHAQIEAWKNKFPFSYRQEGNVIKPQYVAQTLSDMLNGEDVIYVTDVGQHQMWAMQHLQTSNPRGFLSSGGYGTMGYGLPAALGAKLGNPNKRVVLVTGDASLRMLTNTLELYTPKMDIKIMVVDNSSPGRPSGGMVHQWLKRGQNPKTRLKVRGSSRTVSIARGYGVEASDVKDPAMVPDSISWALQTKGPHLLNFIVDPDEDIYPFIPPGKSVTEMELEPTRKEMQRIES